MKHSHTCMKKCFNSVYNNNSVSQPIVMCPSGQRWRTPLTAIGRSYWLRINLFLPTFHPSPSNTLKWVWLWVWSIVHHSIQVWNKDVLLKTIDVKNLGKHGKIHEDGNTNTLTSHTSHTPPHNILTHLHRAHSNFPSMASNCCTLLRKKSPKQNLTSKKTPNPLRINQPSTQ